MGSGGGQCETARRFLEWMGLSQSPVSQSTAAYTVPQTNTNNRAWKKLPFACTETCSARNSSTSERETMPSSAALEREPAIARRKNSCGVDIAKVSILMFFRSACLASAGNSRAEFGFGIDAATIDVILRVKVCFVE